MTLSSMEPNHSVFYFDLKVLGQLSLICSLLEIGFSMSIQIDTLVSRLIGKCELDIKRHHTAYEILCKYKHSNQSIW